MKAFGVSLVLVWRSTESASNWMFNTLLHSGGSFRVQRHLFGNSEDISADTFIYCIPYENISFISYNMMLIRFCMILLLKVCLFLFLLQVGISALLEWNGVLKEPLASGSWRDSQTKDVSRGRFFL